MEKQKMIHQEWRCLEMSQIFPDDIFQYHQEPLGTHTPDV